jgi:hypothetical protein
LFLCPFFSFSCFLFFHYPFLLFFQSFKLYVETWLHYLREHTSILSVILILFVTLVLILIFNRKHIDMKKVEQVQMMQRLAKQQHELMEFINLYIIADSS